MRIIDWSSDVCSSVLVARHEQLAVVRERFQEWFDDLFDGGQQDAVESCFLFFKILVEIGLHGYWFDDCGFGNGSVFIRVSARAPRGTTSSLRAASSTGGGGRKAFITKSGSCRCTDS